MKVIGLNGEYHKMDLRGCIPPKDDERERSSLHLRARALLGEVFPVDNRLEEVFLPGSGGLTVDFFLPLRRLMVEVQGEQHYRMNSFFFKNTIEFAQARLRDANKALWAELNNFVLVCLPYDENDEQWRRRILR